MVEGEDEEEGSNEVADRPSYIDLERMAAHESDVEGGGVSSSSSEAAAADPAVPPHDDGGGGGNTTAAREEKPNLRLVDVRLPTVLPITPLRDQTN